MNLALIIWLLGASLVAHQYRICLGQPTPVFLPGRNPMDRRAWRVTAHGVAKELNMTEQVNNTV